MGSHCEHGYDHTTDCMICSSPKRGSDMRCRTCLWFGVGQCRVKDEPVSVNPDTWCGRWEGQPHDKDATIARLQAEVEALKAERARWTYGSLALQAQHEALKTAVRREIEEIRQAIEQTSSDDFVPWLWQQPIARLLALLDPPGHAPLPDDPVERIRVLRDEWDQSPPPPVAPVEGGDGEVES